MQGIRLILVAPKYSGNIGATARVAANFDVRDILVVAPRCKVHDPEAKRLARGPSQSYLEGMVIVDTLAQALDGYHFAVALSRRVGELSPPDLPFVKLPGWLEDHAKASHRVALVFGREDRCLYREEMALCTHQLTIPTSAVMPTMNLSHSIAVVLGAIFTAGRESPALRKAKPVAPLTQLENLMTHWERAMLDAGMGDKHNLDLMILRLKRALYRAELKRHEVSLIRGFLSEVQKTLGTRVRRGGNSVDLVGATAIPSGTGSLSASQRTATPDHAVSGQVST